MKNIVLIGFMGTGKSTVGRRLAQRLNRRFVDTDTEIESVTGKTVAQIFARHGMVRFRSEEALLVKKLAPQEGLVISTGGGMVLDPENVFLLKKNGVLIGLTALPEIIFNRVKKKKNRPLLAKGDLKEQIEKLLRERQNAYDVAEYTVDTGAFPQEEVVEKIVRYLEEKQEL
ncbi:shikimate kinase [Pelotomaculum isophthalicicum JI]|uniref:Shikimate kinase n=1 Tax=Pelotomaculum isophthalicicum JI TaxID=947010 RepID=A0A9X4H7G7_9FIRM|nr:shikimate kinase [Pelotomaculum isophthalicicum]MDF9409479.1 shikimate kinase [Pelotomaculum isophthalicicum JI]